MCKNVQKCAKIKSETENSLKKSRKIKQNVQKCAKMCKNVKLIYSFLIINKNDYSK